MPSVSDPQLQQAAFAVLEAARAQLAELTLADLFAAQLPPERAAQFVAEFLFHSAGVDSRPPASMVAAAKRALRALVREFLAAHAGAAPALTDLIAPLLPFLACAADCEELAARLARADGGEAPDGGEPGASLQAQKKRDIQRAFTFCLSKHAEEDARFSISTTKAIIGSETLTAHTGTQDSDDGDPIPEPEEPVPDEPETLN
jgi:hypothetical protein